MVSEIIDVLNQLGLLSIIRTAAIVVIAVYLYRYFTDKS